MKIEVGDTITFRAITRWSGSQATRKVKEVGPRGMSFMVRYGGWSHFVVARHEVIKVNGVSIHD